MGQRLKRLVKTTYWKKAKNYFEKDFFKSMNNAVFSKTMENVRKDRDIELATIKARWNYLVSEPNIIQQKLFSENLLAKEMKKIQIYMNRPVY